MHTAKSLKNKSYFHIYIYICVCVCVCVCIYIYIYKNKIRKYVLARILALITSLLKSREPGQYFWVGHPLQ
jgi:hypothetical protein